MTRIDILAYKMYSYDTDAFIEDIIDYSNNSIILIHDFDKITVSYKPSNVKFNKITIRSFSTNNSKLNYYLSPLLLLIHSFMLTKLFLIICWKYRPKVCWIENVYAAVIVGVLRKCHLCGKSIHVPGDWLVSTSKQKLFSYIANNLLFPILDYWACRLNDLVLDHADRITEARYKFWGKKVAKKEKPYLYKPRIKTNNIRIDKMSKNICFIGDMRKDSGLDIAIKSLSYIRNQKDIVLKIIGPKRQNYDYFTNLTKEYHVEPYVDFLGFLETDKLGEILDDCFCGINILTSINSYSNYATPGKQIHYLQFLLPIIATENSGTLVTMIKEKKLGVIIEPLEDAFQEAIIQVYADQEKYRKNIISFINSLQQVSIKELIET